MKKLLALTLIMVMALSFAACSGAKDADETATEPPQTTDFSTNTTSIDKSDIVVDADKNDVAMETEAEYIVFNVDLGFKLESDAWLGVIPTGTIYENEVDADDVDILYTYCENLDADGAVSHRFAFEKEYFYGIEDGIYDMVLCSSDDEEIGKVLLQIGMEKNGDKIVLDYENKQ